MKSSILSLAILATLGVPALCQSAAPYAIAIQGDSTTQNYLDILAIQGLDVRELLRGRTTALRKVRSECDFSFMRVWDGTSTLSQMVGQGDSSESATIWMQDPDGSPSYKNRLVLGGMAVDQWTLFAENGAFSTESVQFAYSSEQVEVPQKQGN